MAENFSLPPSLASLCDLWFFCCPLSPELKDFALCHCPQCVTVFFYRVRCLCRAPEPDQPLSPPDDEASRLLVREFLCLRLHLPRERLTDIES